MNKEKTLKWIIIFLMLSNGYLIITDLFVLVGKTKLQLLHLPSMFFSFLMFVIAVFLIKNLYWLLAFFFKALHTLCLAIASKYVLEWGGYDLPVSSKIALTSGIVFLAVSIFAFYNLVRAKDIISQKNTYLWMQKLTNHLRKK